MFLRGIKTKLIVGPNFFISAFFFLDFRGKRNMQLSHFVRLLMAMCQLVFKLFFYFWVWRCGVVLGDRFFLLSFFQSMQSEKVLTVYICAVAVCTTLQGCATCRCNAKHCNRVLSFLFFLKLWSHFIGLSSLSQQNPFENTGFFN